MFPSQYLASAFLFFFFLMIRRPPRSPLFPSTPLFRSLTCWLMHLLSRLRLPHAMPVKLDRKSTRLNSSHLVISYAVFCLKKKKLLHEADNASARNLAQLAGVVFGGLCRPVQDLPLPKPRSGPAPAPCEPVSFFLMRGNTPKSPVFPFQAPVQD